MAFFDAYILSGRIPAASLSSKRNYQFVLTIEALAFPAKTSSAERASYSILPKLAVYGFISQQSCVVHLRAGISSSK
jgi:hypothetical protein